ncbi:MAG: hypothetical protein A2X36_05675 [Elusimicrobia bacterium GWA2_69_24]|nr:MAG: hypothetical protein A2W08_09370 [Candidatus Rokubacteria bacterium RBG_16_73_20]OGR57627.1 MAG: hypothetical protein A2X36_05675 [Elusimicrobia bacterium GWA2_69_24]HBH02512.1 hypothetical protein [Candidatus Rokubacteria bacterium]
MRGRRLRAAGLVLFGVVLALLGGELLARWQFELPDTMIEPDAALGWRHVPNRAGWYSESAWRFEGKPRIPVRINSQGLLEREYPLRKADGARRVLVLADSFGGDFGVPFDALFPKVAEARANAGRPERRYEVINAGVSGFGTAQELVMFRALGRRYEPDVVVLAFYMNDVGDNGDGYRRRPRFSLREGRLVSEAPALDSSDIESLPATRLLNAHSRLFRLVREKLIRWPAARGLLARLHLANPRVLQADAAYRGWLAIFLTEDDRTAEDQWRLTEALIRQLRDEVRAAGARFAVMIFPMEGQVYPERFTPFWRQYYAGRDYDLDRPNRALARFLAREEIPALDLLPALRARAAQGEADLYRPGDIHWTPKGHAIAGEALVEFLARQGLLGP